MRAIITVSMEQVAVTVAASILSTYLSMTPSQGNVKVFSFNITEVGSIFGKDTRQFHYKLIEIIWHDNLYVQDHFHKDNNPYYHYQLLLSLLVVLLYFQFE